MEISNVDYFNDFFKQNYAALLNYAFKFTRNRATADDIVQESFVALWKNKHSMESVNSLKAYTFKMVRNKSLNYIRDHKREVLSPEFSDTVVENLSEEINQSNSVDRKLSLLKCWIQKLPNRQREAFELSRFEGLDHDEIAHVMNVSDRTVNNHIVEALKNLRAMHEDYQINSKN